LTEIPASHPRKASLETRERLVQGFRRGLVAEQGLLAHGRGEAFDYLLAERTQPFATRAIRAAAAHLRLAARPVVSVNGNVAALCPEAVARVAKAAGARVEVNLFHRTEERVARIVDWLESHGCEKVLGAHPDARIPGIDHARALCRKEGIFGADVVLVPLEDGDRAQALAAMGKDVLTIDLNPLSRTAVAGTVTIVDNVVRALPAMAAELEGGFAPDSAREFLESYNNAQSLLEAETFLRAQTRALAGLADSGPRRMV